MFYWTKVLDKLGGDVKLKLLCFASSEAKYKNPNRGQNQSQQMLQP